MSDETGSMSEKTEDLSDELNEPNRPRSPQYSAKVMAILNEMSSSEFYQPDLDLTGLINKLFPTEQSLSLLDTVVQRIDDEMKELDEEISNLVETHGQVTSEGIEAINSV
jgi:hypothetical protein